LVANIFEALEVDTGPNRRITVVAVLCPAWKSFFTRVVSERVVSERETSLELAEDASWGGKRVLPPAA
jgi:hypothetical protein